MRFLWMAFLIATVPAALAQDDDRPDLTGKWQSDGNSVTLNIVVKDDALQYTQDTRGETAQFNCTTDGKECSMSDGGHKAKVSTWYNGASLVVMETKGNSVIKRKLTLNGTSLEMEVVPIVPQGKTDKLVFTKQS